MPLFQVQSSHFFMFPSHLLYHPCNKLSCYFFFSNLGGLRFQARPFPPFLVLFYVYQGEEMLLKRAIFLFLSLSRITHNRQRWMMLSFQVQSSYFFMFHFHLLYNPCNKLSCCNFSFLPNLGGSRFQARPFFFLSVLFFCPPR